MLAREELGKARILRDLSGQVRQGKSVTEQQLADVMDDHIEKQTKAQLSAMWNAPAGSPLAKLFGSLSLGAEHPDYQAAWDAIAEVKKRKAKRTPAIATRRAYVPSTLTPIGLEVGVARS